MLFDPCFQFKEHHSRQTTLLSILPDYDEFNIKKLCSYFEGFDFFDLAFDNLDHISRLATRSLKPKISHTEIEEIVEIIQNLGIYALLKRDVEVYQACCNGLWKIGRKYIPLVLAKNEKDLTDNFHLRLKVWTCLYRISCYPCFNKLPCGVLDFKEKLFVEGIAVIHFGSLMNIAKFKEQPIPCSCVSTSWKLLIPSPMDMSFGNIFLEYFSLKYPSEAIDDDFFKTAYANVCSLPKELFLTIFYSLFPAFFQDMKKAGLLLTHFHSKISPFPSILYENLIDCFSKNPLLVQHCERLLNDFTMKLNNVKDEIATNYFPDNFSSISTLVDEYLSPPKFGDDKFQLFLRLFVISLNDSEMAKTLVSLIESFWGKTKLPKIYSYYLLLLAATIKIHGQKYVIKQIVSLTGDDICPRECLFIRFYILQRTPSSDFRNVFNLLKPKIFASSSNFTSIIKAFPLTVAAHPSEAPLMLTLFPKELFRNLSTENLSTFINGIHRLSPIPSFVFELFQRDLKLDTAFIVNFFAFQLSTSSILSIEKVFKAERLTMEFTERLVEATVRQDKKFSTKSSLFGYQLALLYCFTKKFMKTNEGKDYFSKLIKLISQSEIGMVTNPVEAVKVIDTAVNQNSHLSSNLYNKWIFAIIRQNVESVPECLPIVCGLTCEIVLSDSFNKSSHGYQGSANSSPLVYVLNNFIKNYLINGEFIDKKHQLSFLKKMTDLKFPAKLLKENLGFVKSFKAELEEKIDDLEFSVGDIY